MPNVKLDPGKFAAQAEAAAREAKARFDAGEVKAASWIARHPVWTLAIGIILVLADIALAFKAYG